MLTSIQVLDLQSLCFQCTLRHTLGERKVGALQTVILRCPHRCAAELIAERATASQMQEILINLLCYGFADGGQAGYSPHTCLTHSKIPSSEACAVLCSTHVNMCSALIWAA